jgi:hypothetical protein
MPTHWCHIIVLKVHVATEDKTDNGKDSYYEELEHVFDTFPKYHLKIMLGDFNSKVGREGIFKPTIGNESSHEIMIMIMIMEISKLRHI